MSVKSKAATKRKPNPATRGKSKPTLSTPQADDLATMQQLRQRLLWLLAHQTPHLEHLSRRMRWPLGSVTCAEVPDRLRRELGLAIDYWRNKVQPYIVGRKLRSVELYVADDAYLRLKGACDKAAEWNRNTSEEGQPAPIPLPDFGDPEFRWPDVYAEDFPPPETIATIAAPLLPKPETPLSAEDAVRHACALFSAAKQYRDSLPHRPPAGKELEAELEAGLGSYVTVAEIHESNKTNSGRLPLLPNLRVRRKGMEDRQQKKPKQITGAQTKAAILDAMLDFEKERSPKITEEQFNREQDQMETNIKTGLVIRLGKPDGKPPTWQEWQKGLQQSIDDVKQNQHLCFHDLCTLRWQRFTKQANKQKDIATIRNAAKSAS